MKLSIVFYSDILVTLLPTGLDYSIIHYSVIRPDRPDHIFISQRSNSPILTLIIANEVLKSFDTNKKRTCIVWILIKYLESSVY